jgi:hypothetical protein
MGPRSRCDQPCDVCCVSELSAMAGSTLPDREQLVYGATDISSAARRTAGALASKWGQGYDEAVASTLIALLLDPSPQVRRASIDAIDFVVCGTENVKAGAPKPSTEPLLSASKSYMATAFWTGAASSRQLAALDTETSDYLADGQATRDQAMKATKDSIRKNWECLRAANFRGLDLSSIELFQANLQDSDLRESDLSWTDLWRADLSGSLLGPAETPSEFSVRSVEYANVAGIQGAEAFRIWALAHRAVEMSREDYQRWKARWQSEAAKLQQVDWVRWVHDDFKIDNSASPVTAGRASLLDSIGTAPSELTRLLDDA